MAEHRSCGRRAAVADVPSEPDHLTAPRLGGLVARRLAGLLDDRPGRRSPAHWAADRYVEGRMWHLEARLWSRCSPAFREAVELWSQVVERELRLLSRRVARVEAETRVLARVRADRVEAARFWDVVGHAWTSA